MLSGALVFALFLFSCKDKNSGSDTTFDRKSMLQHYGVNLTRPAFSNLQSDMTALQTAWQAFLISPAEPQLETVKAAWMAAYTRWQSANAYNFGPAGEQGLSKTLAEEIGVFPVDFVQIEILIGAGDTTLANPKRETRGFLALEYLLYKQTAGNLLTSGKHRAYTHALIRHLQNRIDAVVSGWSAYGASFPESDGTEAGSSTSLMYNSFVASYELLKNYKVALPAGKQAGQTQPEPERVEAYYSGASLPMLKAHFAALERLYRGIGADGQDGPGLEEYVKSVTGGTSLATSIDAQLQNVRLALNAVPSDKPLSELMAENHPTVDNLHTELQKMTRYFKSDMSSLLGIAITFSSGDGD